MQPFLIVASLYCVRVIFRNTEAQLIKACKKQNRKAQKELFDRYCDQMLILCMRYIDDSNDAKDIVQESFITIFEKIDSYSGKGSFEGWMKRIFINNCLMYCRKVKRSKNVPLTDDVSIEDTQNSWKAPVDLHVLMGLVKRLPEGYSNVFNLYVLDDYTHPEIADMLNISVNTSKSQLSRARKLLQKMLTEEKILIGDE